MKKLFAILLSMLMLCTMIPFATVSAAEGINIVLEVSDEEINAGDEFEVTAYLEGNPGLIGVQVIIRYDTDNLELVGEWDGEDFWPEISNPRKWKANFISYGPPGTCIVTYLNATASSEVTEEEYFTALFKAKDDAYTGNYDLTVEYNPANFFGLGLENVPVTGVENGSIYVNGRDPEPEIPACEHEYTYACDKVCAKCGELTNEAAEHSVKHVDAKDATCYEDGNIEYWYCEYCGVAWADEALTQQTNLKNVVTPMAHGTIAHVEAVAPTCYEDGNIEYWYCEACGQAWLDEACTLNTNLKAVVLPMAHGTITHVEAKEATCDEPGNIEYWYCEACGQAWLDEACTLNTNLMAVVLPIAHNVIHVEAKDATCFEEGNIEYWYCDICGAAWTDELLREVTNLKNVILPIAHNVIYVEAKDATCTELGNIEYWYCDICGSAWLDEYCHLNTNLMAVKLPMAEHTYDDDLDVDCNVCGDIRVVTYEVKTYGGASMQESNDGLSGLAFKFKLTDKISGLAVKEGTLYAADYTNAYVTPDSTGTYKLVKMGAKVSNGKQTLNVPVQKWILEGNDAPYYAIRIVNIPEAQYDTTITCTPYFVYEDAEGNRVTVYGDAVSSCVNNHIG